MKKNRQNTISQRPRTKQHYSSSDFNSQSNSANSAQTAKQELSLRPPQLVVVLGMHRSGTSTLTRALKALDVQLGENLIPGIIGDNDKGFWEDIDLNNFDNELLQTLGSDWQRLAPITANDVEQLRNHGYFLKALDLLKRIIGQHTLFGIKDPRIACLMPFWKTIFSHLPNHRVAYLIVLRNPLSIARSLAKRDGIPYEKSHLLWLNHILPSLAYTNSERRFLVNYDSLIENPAENLRQIAAALDLEINESELNLFCNDFLDRNLQHSSYRPADLRLDESCLPLAQEVYQALTNETTWQTCLDNPEFWQRVEAWQQDYLRLLAPLRLIDKLDSQARETNALLTANCNEISNLNGSLSQNESRFLELNQALNEQDRRIDALNQTVAEKDSQINVLNQTVAEKDSANTALNQALNENDYRIEVLNQTVAEIDSANTALNHALNEKNYRIEVLNQTLNEKNHQYDLLNQTLTEKNVQIGELLIKINDFHSDICLLRDNLAVSATQNEQTDQALCRQQAHLQELGDSLNQLKAQIAEANQGAIQSNIQIAKLSSDVAARDQQLAVILRSKSWLLTKPFRGGRRLLLSRPYAYLRKRYAGITRGKHAKAPRAKQVQSRPWKNILFKQFPTFLGWTRGYQVWQQQNAVLTQKSPDKNPGREITTPTEVSHESKTATTDDYVPLTQAKPLSAKPVKLICFYLPQFHAIPENDQWWGTGFTEWTNVKPACPQFEGHYQPHEPNELGYYNLLDPAVQRRQVELAQLYGIEAFCFYFYWFAGQRLLEAPIRNYLLDQSLNLPFCLCWANENWSRRWDGLDSEILMAQKHSAEDDLAFIAHVADYFKDPRYLRVNGKPLLLVYRPSLLPSPSETAERWRSWCRQTGLGEIYLAYTQSFECTDPAVYGFDAAIEFPPNNSAPPDITGQIKPLEPDFAGTVYDWRVFIERSKQYKDTGYTLFRSVCPAWDNTARRKNRGTIFHHSSPALYQRWLGNAIADTCRTHSRYDERLIFVNAWNEWAEGAHLEPDARYGYAYLQATRNALAQSCHHDCRSILVVTHDCHPHGAQYLILAMCRKLRDMGIDVAVLALNGGLFSQDFAEFSAFFNASEHTPTALKAFLTRLNAEGTIDAITNTVVSGSVLPLLKELNFRVLSLIHELPGVIQAMSQENNAQKIAEHADKIVFPSRWVHKRFNEVVSIAADKVFIQPQGLLRKNPYKERKAEAFRLICHKHGLPETCRIVLNVAYLDTRKGGDLFVEIAAKTIKSHPDAVFIWVGHADPEMEKQINSSIKQLALKNKVILAGFDREPMAYYAAASVYALTSREDPFPNVVLESLEVGVPIVAFDGATGAGELIVERGGKLAAFSNTQDFAKQIGELLDQRVQCPDLPVASMNQYVQDLLHHLTGFPRISVVVPNYNYAHHIRRRLASVCSQQQPIYEIIVLDDASTDGSAEIIKEFLEQTEIDSRLIVNENNSGSVFRQWQKGLTLATGDLIWIAEADDLADDTFIDSLAGRFYDDSTVLAFCQSKQIDENDDLLAPHYLDYTRDVSDIWVKDYFRNGLIEIQEALCIKNTIPNVSAVLFRRSALVNAFKTIGTELFDYRVAGDWLIYLHVLLQGKIYFCARALNQHRRHRVSVTRSTQKLKHLEEVSQVQKIACDLTGPNARELAKAERYLDYLREYFELPKPDFAIDKIN